MRYLLHLGLVAGVLVVAAVVEAQPSRPADRDRAVFVAGHGHPRYHEVRRVRYVPPPTGRWQPARGDNRRLARERRNLEQILDISYAWRRATAARDPYAQSMVNRRLETWIDRELRQAWRDPNDRAYGRRVREIGIELDSLSWRFSRGRARRHHYVRQSRLLDELVALSELQVRRARGFGRRWERYPLARF